MENNSKINTDENIYQKHSQQQLLSIIFVRFFGLCFMLYVMLHNITTFSIVMCVFVMLFWFMGNIELWQRIGIINPRSQFAFNLIKLMRKRNSWSEQGRKQYVTIFIISTIAVIIIIGQYLYADWQGKQLEKEMEQKKKDKQEQLK